MNSLIRLGVVAAAAWALASCGGGGGDSGSGSNSLPGPTPTVTIGMASTPPGLRLTLDGRDAPATFTETAGVTRNIGATNQKVNGHLFEFSGWNVGGAALQTIVTPSTNTSYTATFIDRGLSSNNVPGAVAVSVSATGKVGTAMALSGSAQDNDPGDAVTSVQFLVNGMPIAETSTAPYQTTWTPTTAGLYNVGLRATDRFGLAKDSPTIEVNVAP